MATDDNSISQLRRKIAEGIVEAPWASNTRGKNPMQLLPFMVGSISALAPFCFSS